MKVPMRIIFASCAVFLLVLYFTEDALYKAVLLSSDDDMTVLRIFFAVALPVLTIAISVFRNNMSARVNNLVSKAWFGVTPFLMFLALEFMNSKRFDTDVRLMEPVYVLLNLVIYYMLAFLLLLLTNSYRLAALLSSVFIALFGILNYQLYDFRRLCIVASDIYSVKTALSVAGNYTFNLDASVHFMMAVMLLCAAFCALLSPQPRCWRHSLKARLIGAASWLTAFAVCLQVYVFTDTLENLGISVKLYLPQNRYSIYGTMLTTVGTVHYLIVEKPEGYSVEKVKEISDSYEDKKTKSISPDVIVVMDESLCDYYEVGEGNVPTYEDYLPYIHSMKENTVKGIAYSSVFGGNTANSEFEYLTGNTMAFLTANSVPYQLFVKGDFPALPWALKNAGYSGAVAMHPYYPTGFSRRSVYPLFKFDKFLSIEDDVYAKASYMRDFVSDKSDFKALTGEYERLTAKSKEPVFIFNVTMQNHGGYEIYSSAPWKDLELKDGFEKSMAETYINLAHKSDTAFKYLIDYFKKVERPAAIILFGDHHPSMTSDFYTYVMGKDDLTLNAEEWMEKYKVPFVMWTNYDIEEEKVEGISLNYLSAYLSDIAGIPMTGYSKFLIDMQKKVPVITAMGYYGDDGKFYLLDDERSPYYDQLADYRILEYNNVLDRKNRYNDFFVNSDIPFRDQSNGG